MVEIESVINARPITYVYDDTNSISYPLTPSDLVYGRRVTLTPNSAHHEIISTHKSLTRRARHHKNVLHQVTKQWRRNISLVYLNSQIRETKEMRFKKSQLEILCCSKPIQRIEFTGRLQELRNLFPELMEKFVLRSSRSGTATNDRPISGGSYNI